MKVAKSSRKERPPTRKALKITSLKGPSRAPALPRKAVLTVPPPTSVPAPPTPAASSRPVLTANFKRVEDRFTCARFEMTSTSVKGGLFGRIAGMAESVFLKYSVVGAAQRVRITVELL